MDDTIPQDIPQRKCTGHCQQVKPLTDFYGWTRKKRDGTRSMGYQSRCKVCILEENKNRPDSYREHANELDRIRRKEGRKAKKKRESPESSRKRDLQTYGMTVQDYDAMLVAQNGVCAICKQTETAINHITKAPKRLAVDHNHQTGKVRGLLCTRCNIGLGYFERKYDAYVEYLGLNSKI